MQSSALRFWIFSGGILFWLLTSKPTAAQIVPDTTLPMNSIVPPNCTNCEITGGSTVGNNLFHSFEQFSIPIDGTAYFKNATTIENIISRVTGKSISNIDGLIRANGNANLFLLNPNGIIFGPQASLKIGGSFLATTADSFLFENGFAFSASNLQAPPLLTINVPIGLQFGQAPGEIRNESLAPLIDFSTGNRVFDNKGQPIPAGLQVAPGRTLALVGGQMVKLPRGRLTVEGGRIELGSVAGNGLVNLSESATGYTLDYTGIQNFGDIHLSHGAMVDASGNVGGAIQLQGRNITLTDGSHVLSRTLGAGIGGILTINAAESVSLSGASTIETSTEGKGKAGDVLVIALDSVELAESESKEQLAGLYSQVCVVSPNCRNVTGNGGDVTIVTRQLRITDGARVDASTFGAGRAGDVLVIASDAVNLIGASPNDGTITSGIFTQAPSQAIGGNAGNLTINTRQLNAQGGGQVSTATFSGGIGGTLTINASDSIRLSGASPAAIRNQYRSGIFASAELGATLEAGKLNITTGQLTVENGAEISANNFGTGDGGTATLKVEQLIIQDGGEVRANSFGEGPGGNLIVNADESVQVMGTGTIGFNRIPVTSALSVSSEGSGKAGDLQVQARSVQLDNSGSISADTSGGGGNIELRSPSLILRRGSSITTNATESEISGGNITLNTDVLAALENSDIRADSAEFKGGTIIINAQGIFGTEFRDALTPESDITATGANSELSGIVEINTPEVDPSQGLANLPDAPVNVEVTQGCQAAGEETSVEFFNTGRGGLAPNPYEPLSSNDIWEDVPFPTQGTENPAAEKSTPASSVTPPDKIVTAKGWIFNEKGEVTLVAEMPSTRSQVGCRLH